MFSAHLEYGIREKYRAWFAEYHATQANWDAHKQIEDIRALLARDIDLLVIDPLEDVTVANGLEQAQLPLILAGSTLDISGNVVRVRLPTEDQGRASADWLAHTVGSGRVIVLSSRTGLSSGAEWLRGVRASALAEFADLEHSFVRSSWSVDSARDALAAVLTEHDVIDGVLVNNGLLALGAAQAFLDRGLSIPPISGADDWNGWLRFAREHDILFTGYSGAANMGLLCITLAVQLLSGESVPAVTTFGYELLDNSSLDRFYRPELNDHYWGVHDLPEAWIQRMFRL